MKIFDFPKKSQKELKLYSCVENCGFYSLNRNGDRPKMSKSDTNLKSFRYSNSIFLKAPGWLLPLESQSKNSNLHWNVRWENHLFASFFRNSDSPKNTRKGDWFISILSPKFSRNNSFDFFNHSLNRKIHICGGGFGWKFFILIFASKNWQSENSQKCL